MCGPSPFVRRLLAIGFIAPILLASAFGSWRWFIAPDGPSRHSAVLGNAQELATPLPSATPRLWRQPRPVPVTPVAVQYVTVDPAFQPLPGARAFYGNYAGGVYQIEVPDRWNGDVVYFAHGFRGNPPQLTVSAPPLRPYFIEHGYAWAASSYSRNGYEPGVAARDTLALELIFAQRVARPRFSYIDGESMGGNVVTFSLEHFPTAYDGALSECGVVSGPEVLDYFASWAALAQYFSGTHFIDDTMTSAGLDTAFSQRVLPALGTPDAPTDAGRAFTDAIMRLTGGPRPFFEQGLAHQFGANFTVIAHAAELAGPSSGAAQNNDTLYTLGPGFAPAADQLNREIDRFVPAPAYRDAAAYPEFQPMTGEIERPLITLHGTGDLFVPIGLEQSYARKVHSAGRDHLLVQRAVRRAGHCNFSDGERERAFDDLVAWVEQGRRPEGEDLSGDLSNAGLRFTAPFETNDPSLAPDAGAVRGAR